MLSHTHLKYFIDFFIYDYFHLIWNGTRFVFNQPYFGQFNFVFNKMSYSGYVQEYFTVFIQQLLLSQFVVQCSILDWWLHPSLFPFALNGTVEWFLHLLPLHLLRCLHPLARMLPMLLVQCMHYLFSVAFSTTVVFYDFFTVSEGV